MLRDANGPLPQLAATAHNALTWHNASKKAACRAKSVSQARYLAR
eukprot:gene53133-72569_t